MELEKLGLIIYVLLFLCLLNSSSNKCSCESGTNVSLVICFLYDYVQLRKNRKNMKFFYFLGSHDL